MGKRVQEFFVKISFGWWGYRMDRTYNIMRIATTASPVSGADVRQRMSHLRHLTKVDYLIDVIYVAYRHYKERKEGKRIKELEHQAWRSRYSLPSWNSQNRQAANLTRVLTNTIPHASNASLLGRIASCSKHWEHVCWNILAWKMHNTQILDLFMVPSEQVWKVVRSRSKSKHFKVKTSVTRVDYWRRICRLGKIGTK